LYLGCEFLVKSNAHQVAVTGSAGNLARGGTENELEALQSVRTDIHFGGISLPATGK
jgi:hypothetical protein